MVLSIVASLVLSLPPVLDCVLLHGSDAANRRHLAQETGAGAHVNHEDLYNRGTSFPDFLDRAERRRQLWVDNYRDGMVPDALLARARAVRGTWYLLAVAVDSCSDSANTIPYLARLTEQVSGLDLRIVNSTLGRHIMEAHRTPDGRASTPTVVLLDSDFDEVGCFIERPGQLQDWWLANLEQYGREELVQKKMDWYADDAGKSTIAEIVERMERAAAGEPIC